MMIIGIALVWFGLHQTITVHVDGEPRTVRIAAITVSDAVHAAGLTADQADRVRPSMDSWIWNQSAIIIETAQTVVIKTPDEEFVLRSAERLPANLLSGVGIRLYPHDQVLINGEIIDPRMLLETTGSVLLQYEPAKLIRLSIDDSEENIYTDQPTVGAALETALIPINPQDWVSEDLSAPVVDSMDISIRRARPVTVTTADHSVAGLTNAVTVGDALWDIGVPLQNLDYSFPAEEAPVPEDGVIRVVRVNENLVIATEEFPIDPVYQEDPNTTLDQVAVIEPGQNGIFASRERIQYADGEEVWRMFEDGWQASEAKAAVLGYGSNIVIQTEVVEGETLEYYRKLTVFATAYSPCNLGVDYCNDVTYSGRLLTKGIIGVTRSWYSVMGGQQVYVTGYGYGVIADIGGGYPGRPWIDLGFTDETYQTTARWVTMYLLTPVPGYVPLILP